MTESFALKRSGSCLSLFVSNLAEEKHPEHYLPVLSTQSTSQRATKLKSPSYQPASSPPCASLLHHMTEVDFTEVQSLTDVNFHL